MLSASSNSVVAPLVAPAKKSCAVPCRPVPHLDRAQTLCHRYFAARGAELCRAMPLPAGLCRKRPFLYGVQEVVGSNPAGPIPSARMLPQMNGLILEQRCHPIESTREGIARLRRSFTPPITRVSIRSSPGPYS